MHSAAYRALGLDWHYVPFEIEEAQLASALAAMRVLNIRGFGISMPFKLQIMPMLDAIDDLAARIGSINTVVNDSGRLVGHNTDWLGAVRALEEVAPIGERHVLVLGAGGAARAVAFGLIERRARVSLCNRSFDRAQALARELGATARTWEERTALHDVDILVNASSLGMSTIDPCSPVADAVLRPELTVMDIVYKPLDTTLIRSARDVGATVIHGGRMLLHQAAAQFELYTGQRAPLEAMDAALRAAMARA
jgi:shikimate dehydrogenase